MGRSGKEESSPIQPDGNLLSLVGDVLFAGAIMTMIYPALRRTASRLDGQFFRQLLHIFQVLLAVAVLCFVLMLLIGQQMRIAYCSFIRPYIGLGRTDDEKVYLGMLLKVLVCALLMFNYFCARELQKLVRFLSNRIQSALCIDGRISRSESPPAPYPLMGEDALTNNSNTNSQTPVTQTQTVMQSDILPSMSFPELSLKARRFGPVNDKNASAPPFKRHQRLCRDVGTMVRFPTAGTEYQTNSPCTLHLCPAMPPHPYMAPATILYSTFPSTTPCSPQPFTPVTQHQDTAGNTSYPKPQVSAGGRPAGLSMRSTGCGSGLVISEKAYPQTASSRPAGISVRSTGCGSELVISEKSHPQAASSRPAKVPMRSTGCGSGLVISDSTCHFHLNNPPSPGPNDGSPLRALHSFHSTTSSRASSSAYSTGKGPSRVASECSSCRTSSDYTSSSSSSSSIRSDQSGCVKQLDVTSVRGSSSGSSPRPESSLKTDPGQRPADSSSKTDAGASHTQSSSRTSLHTTSAQTDSQRCPASVLSHSCAYNPATAKSSFLISRGSTIAVHSHKHLPVTCSVPSTHVHSCPFGMMPRHVHSGSVGMVSAHPHSTSSKGAGRAHVDGSERAGCCVIQHHSNFTLTGCQCRSTLHVLPPTTPTPPSRPVRRRARFLLPPMPKMTRSGKIYGYG